MQTRDGLRYAVAVWPWQQFTLFLSFILPVERFRISDEAIEAVKFAFEVQEQFVRPSTSVYPPASLIKDTLSLIKDVCSFSVDSFQDGMLGPTTTFTWFFYVISEKTRSILYGTAGKCSKNNFGLS